eukprot:Blabericola_migrator_1__12812@NODE_825_length_6370_cov_320_094241_g582_i0_p4_GENE_NODE_825_length_6370_cov_320_094241_g582_i0NODE_825_length_6370_cov_320_094241_g582_i0_p4_ORF_typecomplete_len270_score32_43VSNARE_C/PF12352_8/2e03VSNARE_C/PF12352_8/2_8e09Sec20/PF03908_13/3_7e08FA_desaturase/PF00487_24/0_0019Bcl2/PF00452_19/0_064IFT20/PF14931_6/1_7e02IFT20/PF14931_6/1_8_NODE_825_length_6370_cov_320_094241_g582_i050595868
MAGLDSLYSQVVKVKSRLDNAVSLLEFGTSNEARDHGDKRPEISTAKQQQLSGLANQLLRHIEDLKQVYSASKRDLSKQQQLTWGRRLEKLEHEAKLLVVSVDKALGYMSVRQQAELDREKLLGDSQARRRDRYKSMGVENLIEEEARRLDNSSLVVQTMIQQGANALSNLKGQKTVMKSTVAKMKSAALSMGVSQSLISSVETRLRSDRLLTYGGMIGIALFLYFLYHWWKGYDPFWWFPYRIIGHVLQLLFVHKHSPHEQIVVTEDV